MKIDDSSSKKSLKYMDVKNLLFDIARPMVRKFRRKVANRAIYNVCSTEKQQKEIRIGFIVQMSSIWDKQVKVYEEAKRRDNIETFLFVVPEDDWSSHKIANHYENNFFVTNYPEAIKIHDTKGNVIDLEDYQLDYLFYPRPYDIHLPKKIRSERMRSICKCCYVPYAFCASDVFNECFIFNRFFYNMYFCFMDSNYMKNMMVHEYSKEIEMGIKKIDYMGYPCLEPYIMMGESNRRDRITWTPRWSYDEKLGGSNFIEYKDHFAELTKKHNGSCIFRPHPLMFDELINRHLISEKETKEYLQFLEKNGAVFDVSSPIDSILEKTDVLISDFSSIVVSFFLTGRPIIYCEKGIELNEVCADMLTYMYVAHSWEDVEKYYRLLVIEKNDYLKEKRKEYISKNFGLELNASKNIIDALIDDSN